MMLKKCKNQKGFTLMEMLIVVAIVAILVAIAIPSFAAALGKAKAGTDTANIRSGYAAAMIEGMTDGGNGDYYLQQDGTVSKTGTDKYTCAGKSDDVADGTMIGGALEVGDEVTWKKDNTIKYTISEQDGKVTVKITAE